MFNSLADEFTDILIAGVFGIADGGDDPFAPEFALPDAVDAGGVVEFGAECVFRLGIDNVVRLFRADSFMEKAFHVFGDAPFELDLIQRREAIHLYFLRFCICFLFCIVYIIAQNSIFVNGKKS